MKVGILGGGLCGLVAGSKIKNSVILEADSSAGGHCRSEISEGYTYDIGGPHIIFSRNKKILNYMKNALGNYMNYGLRDNKCFYKGEFVNYPFENGIYELDPSTRFNFITDFFNADRTGIPKNNLKDWFYQRFGESLSREYLVPYNDKIWNIKSKNLTSDWVEGRIPMPSDEDMLKVACGISTIGYSHQAKFIYPKSGGIQRLTSYFLKKCNNIKLNEKILKIEKVKAKWNVQTSKNSYQFDKIISTIPIHDLLKCIDNVPKNVASSAKKLKFNSLINVALGFKLSKRHTHTAVYIPNPEYLPHRISFPRNFSIDNVPKGRELVNLEITTNFNDKIYNKDKDSLRKLSIELLKNLGYISNQKIEYFNIFKTKHAYVVRDKHYKEALKTSLDFIKKKSIISLGRNAEFEYINMDEAIRRTFEVLKTYSLK